MATVITDNRRYIPKPHVAVIRHTKKGGPMPKEFLTKPIKAATPLLGPPLRITKAEKEATIWFETERKMAARDAFQEKVRADLGLKEPTGFIPTPTYKVEVTNWTPAEVVTTPNVRRGGRSGAGGAPPPLPPSLRPSGPPPDAFEIHPSTGRILTTSEKAIQTKGEKMTGSSRTVRTQADDDRMQVDPAPSQQIVNNYVSNYNQALHNVTNTQNQLTQLFQNDQYTLNFDQRAFTNVNQTNQTVNQYNQLNQQMVANILSDNRQFQQTNFNQMLNDQRRVLHVTGAPADQLVNMMAGQRNGAGHRAQIGTGERRPTRPAIDGAPTQRLIEGPGARYVVPIIEELPDAPAGVIDWPQRQLLRDRSATQQLIQRPHAGPLTRTRVARIEQQRHRKERLARRLGGGR